MIHADYKFLLSADPEVAFDYLANPLNDRLWQASCTAVSMASEQPVAGAGYDITFNFLGRKMNFSCQITERDPLRRYAFKVLDGPFYYQGSYDFDTTANGLNVHWRFGAEPGKFFGIVPASLLRKILISQFERDVIKLVRVFPAAVPA